MNYFSNILTTEEKEYNASVTCYWVLVQSCTFLLGQGEGRHQHSEVWQTKQQQVPNMQLFIIGDLFLPLLGNFLSCCHQ